MTIRGRLLSASVINSLARASGIGIWFVLTPFVLRRLGPEGYALWVLMSAIASYGLLLDAGLGGAVVKYVAEHTARGRRGELRPMLASAAWLYLGLAVVALGAGLAVARVLPALLGVAEAQFDLAVRLVQLAVLNVAITLAFTPWFSMLRGLHRHDLLGAVRIASGWAEAAAVVGALAAGWGALGMMAVLVQVNLTSMIVGVMVAGRAAPDLRVRWRSATPAAIRRLASFSMPLFTIAVAGRMQTRTDEFVIAFFHTLSGVTPYALARKLGELSEVIATEALKAVMPLASALEAGEHRRQLRHLYLVASRIVLGIGVPITIVLCMLGADLLTLWVGAEYAQHAPVLAVLALASLVSTSQWPAMEMLQGTARHRIIAFASLGAGVANVALSVALLPRFGLLGVAFGTLAPAIAAWLGIVMPFANRVLGVSWTTAARDVWIPGLVPGVPAVLLMWALDRQVLSPTATTTGACAAAAAIVYVTVYLLMPAAAAERRLLADLIAGGTGHLRHLAPHPSRPR